MKAYGIGQVIVGLMVLSRQVSLVYEYVLLGYRRSLFHSYILIAASLNLIFNCLGKLCRNSSIKVREICCKTDRKRDGFRVKINPEAFCQLL